MGVIYGIWLLKKKHNTVLSFAAATPSLSTQISQRQHQSQNEEDVEISHVNDSIQQVYIPLICHDVLTHDLFYPGQFTLC